MSDRVFSVLHLFSGLGGGALGFQRARAEMRGLRGRFRTLLGVDLDPGACVDFATLTGWGSGWGTGWGWGAGFGDGSGAGGGFRGRAEGRG